MKIATWNINSINARINHVMRWLELTGTDVLCLQETKSPDRKFPEGFIKAGGYFSAYTGESSYNGVAILSKHPIENVSNMLPGDDEESQKRFIAADVHGIRIVNVYVPQGRKLWTEHFEFKLEWIQRLRRYFDTNCPRNADVLLCGDFNVAPGEIDVWDVKRSEGKIHFSHPERSAIGDLMEWGFVDVFRMMNPAAAEFSWWDMKRKDAFRENRGKRIDHIWTSEELAERILNVWIDKTPREWERPSDHVPVVAEIE